ncbi:ThiF family adenylyltransferase [Corynebacterium uterequi]|uniref:Molybdopterin biosynthesis protein MoeB n=1 Tax=Corynebacterium uterequi TaxID=1072256 RepID=A0A0G3HBS7_9CORY|nr:ThiF family adenylyltransferase [Corynebacterium uterequi]AKK10130.1 molybdopterin biosynthesis protein MoeB [Corynebacterium uterequi]
MSNRYVRQVTLPGFGHAGQEALAAAHVAVVGAGGLGSPALLYLAAAGVGRIRVIDDDAVELSNLHRQVIHTTARVGTSKADSAAATMRELNPEVRVDVVNERVTWDNSRELLDGCDVVLDGSDNFDTRHVVSHACARLRIPHVWASILGFEAQLSVFWAGRGPIYEDLFPTPPAPGTVPSCAQAGVLGPVVGVVGSAMAMEALKIVSGVGTPLVGRLGYFDSLSGTWEYVPLVASSAVTEHVLRQDPPRQTPVDVPEIDHLDGSLLLDVREPEETALGIIPGALLVPLADVLAGWTPADSRVVVYCASGVRSVQAAAALRSRGIDALSLRGGYGRYLRD